MKILFTSIAILLSSFAMAQVIQIQTASNTTDMAQVAILAGFISPINGSTFTGGFIHKKFKDGGKRNGVRLDVQIPIGEFLHFTTITDSYYDNASAVKYQGTFLEIGAGLGVGFKNLSVSLLYQMNCYSPKTNTDREDKPLIKAQYRFNL